MPLTIRSPAFQDGGEIPEQHTCEGKDTSPPLEFQDIPKGTKSLALIVDDPDAPDPKAPTMVFVHWVVYDLPADTTVLKEGLLEKDLPRGAHQGFSDYRKGDWGGPCPPTGRHRYFFKLFALDKAFGLQLRRVNKERLLRLMEGHILEAAELVGTYEKRRA